MTRYLGARSGRPRAHAEPGFVLGAGGVPLRLPDLPPAKEDRLCCPGYRDSLGRLPVGFCSPECEGRPAVWADIVARARRTTA